MKLKEAARLAWRNVETFGYALDYDPVAVIASRVERLERDSQSQQSQLAALTLEVQSLRRAS